MLVVRLSQNSQSSESVQDVVSVARTRHLSGQQNKLKGRWRLQTTTRLCNELARPTTRENNLRGRLSKRVAKRCKAFYPSKSGQVAEEECRDYVSGN